MDEFINQVKNDPEIKQEIVKSYQDFKQLNITTQAEAGKTLFIKHKYMEKVCEVVEDTIINLLDKNDDLKNENVILTNKLEQYGDYNKEECDRLVISKRKNRTNQENKQRVMRELQEAINNSAKAIKN